MLSPTVPTAPELRLDPVSDAPALEVDGSRGGFAVGVSTYVVDLWIDLVSQAESAEPPTRLPSVSGLSRQQFRALNCLQSEPLTMHGLAQCLGVSAAAATATVDRLISAGAVQRFRDTLDRRLVRVVATVAGAQMASEYHATQVSTLQLLIGRMDPGRQAVLSLAMTEISRAMDSPSVALADRPLAPDPAQWASN